MAGKESAELALKRWDELEALQGHYTEFSDFLYDGIVELMGFNCTAVQLDIADFMEHHPNKFKQVQAQRSQAKTTIAAFFAVYCMIHDPTYRVLIFSAASGMSSEISGWIVQIIMGWDLLECMRPDRQAGDRASTENFDIHHSLKGPEKSPSVACLGIESSMQGRRADLVIADDVESSKNSRTQIQRDKLLSYTRDFSSICQKGSILYLGTPQSGDSIYNTLPGRSYTVRVWPGRYPTDEEIPGYGDTLAPMILNRLKADPTLQTGGGPAHDRGKPTDPELLDEELLVSKEIDQGSAYFQLQHMLCTELSDAARFPLKIRNLVMFPLNQDNVPATIAWQPTPENCIGRASQTGVHEDFYRGVATSEEFFEYSHKIMYVDPAGGGQGLGSSVNGTLDETAYCVLYYANGYVYLMDIGAIKGGYDEEVFTELSSVYNKWDVNAAYVERNFGAGALAAMWKQTDPNVAIEEDQVSGQKELRICDTLEPIMAKHRLIVSEEVMQKDVDLCKKYPTEKRSIYQLFFQLQKITRDKDALIHDDRLDCLAGGVTMLMELMQVTEKQAIIRKQTDRYNAMMRDPLGTGIDAFNIGPDKGNAMNSVMNRYRRK